MRTEQWWNDTETVKQKYFDTNVSGATLCTTNSTWNQFESNLCICSYSPFLAAREWKGLFSIGINLSS